MHCAFQLPFLSETSTYKLHQSHQLPSYHRPRIPRARLRRNQQIWFEFLLSRRFFSSYPSAAPEATQVGDRTITQKHLYTGLFVIGLPLLYIASPISTFFWLVGASGFLILSHACMLEPGVESEYATIQDSV